MRTYQKGARWERELLRYLNHKGFSVVRVSASGNQLYPLDVLALKPGLTLAIECKSSQKQLFKKEQVEKLIEWAERAGAIPILAWKQGRRWLFLPAKSWSAGSREWMELKDLLIALMI